MGGAGLLLDPPRDAVKLRVSNRNLFQPQFEEHEILQRLDRLGHIAPSMKRLGQPESPVAVFLSLETEVDNTDTFAGTVFFGNRPCHLLTAGHFGQQHVLQELLRAIVRVRPGDLGCQVPYDVPVVEVFLYRRRIGQRYRAQDQAFGFQYGCFHGMTLQAYSLADKQDWILCAPIHRKRYT